MSLALESSNLSANQVNYVNCHATSTPAGDLAEMNAIKRLFASGGDSMSRCVYVSSLKGSLGHLLGAAGAVESVFTVLACQEKIIPASININKVDPEFKMEEVGRLEIVCNQKRVFENENKKRPLIALKNSFGFGGTNVSLCFSSFEK